MTNHITAAGLREIATKSRQDAPPPSEVSGMADQLAKETITSLSQLAWKAAEWGHTKCEMSLPDSIRLGEKRFIVNIQDPVIDHFTKKGFKAVALSRLTAIDDGGEGNMSRDTIIHLSW